MRVNTLATFDGLKRVPAQSVKFGDIVAISGIEGINIGDTICASDTPEPLHFVKSPSQLWL